MLPFDFTKDHILEDDAVRLSPLRESHAAELADVSSDPSIWTYFLESGQGANNLSRYVQEAIGSRVAEREYPFVVFDKRAGRYAGLTRLYAVNTVTGSLKLGHTWYGTDFQGTGLNKHCKYLLFEFAFEQIGASRIGFGVHADNARSLQALKRVGCRREGVLREYLPRVNGDGRADLVLLSLLRREWLATVKSDLLSEVYGREASSAGTPTQILL